MRILLVGAGGVGSAAVGIAARRDFFEAMVVADYDVRRAERAIDRPSTAFRCLKPKVNVESRAVVVRVVGILLLLAIAHGPAFAQQAAPRAGEPDVPEKAGKELVAHYVGDTPPRIDGDINDEIWQQAQAIDDMVQNDPDNMQPPTERTLVKVAYDDRSVYVAVMNYMTGPGAHYQRARPPRHLPAQRFDQDHLRPAPRSPDRLHL